MLSIDEVVFIFINLILGVSNFNFFVNSFIFFLYLIKLFFLRYLLFKDRFFWEVFNNYNSFV